MAVSALLAIPFTAWQLGLRRAPAASRPTPGASQDLEQVLRMVRAQLDLTRTRGDLRALRNVHAALAPWTDVPEPAAEALLLAATSAQLQGQFGLALRRLEQGLRRAPRDARFELTRAAVLVTRGRYVEARASCRALIPLAVPGLVAGCVAPIDGLTGRYEVAHHGLEHALQMAGSLEQQAWLLSLQGELAFWAGNAARAERALGAALALDPNDRKARLLHVDLLLDTGRVREALDLLAGRDADDAMLLRMALAYDRVGLVDAANDAKARLAERWSGAGEDASLPRDRARLLLSLPGQEARALAAARAAFALRKEPWEARLLLEAALQAGAASAAGPALDWLAQTGFEAPLLRRLAEELRQSS